MPCESYLSTPLDWWHPRSTAPFFNERYIELDECYSGRSRDECITRELNGLREILQRHFGNAPVGTLLDCPCGYGRLTPYLTALADRVFGTDLSEHYVQIARGHCARTDVGMPAHLTVADMRMLPIATGSISCVVNMWTSFGYFRRHDENMSVLFEWARVLQPCGIAIVHTNLNPLALQAGIREHDFLIDRPDGCVLTVTEVYDTAVRRAYGRWTTAADQASRRDYEYDIAVWDVAEWKRNASRAGLEVRMIAGSLDRLDKPLLPTDDEFVCVLERI